MNFKKLGLHNALVQKCESLNFTVPTPIQKKAVPAILRGVDLIGCAETGTGKTAAFLLPAIQKMILEAKPGVRLLVIAPTRELVSQIEEACGQLVTGEISCLSLIGGASVKQQTGRLRRGANIVIATPGRLLDHVRRKTVDLSKIEMLVLDEADRMLDMGFLPEIRKILAELPTDRQTLLFSATMSPSIKGLAYSVMKDPEVIEVSRQNAPARMVEQIVYPVATASKTALLLDLLEKNDYERVIVFTRTKRGAERLTHILQAREMSADSIHADRTQSQREAALRDFRRGKTQVLVATNIASRGIDVESVSHVINYDVPEVPEDYVHRVGRTGRAGNQGLAITLVTPIEEVSMREIERLTGQSVSRIVLKDFCQPTFFNPGQPKPVSQGVKKSGSFRAFRPQHAG